MQPLALKDWLIRDEVFAEQMALRDELIASRPEDVHDLLPCARAAAEECYDAVLTALQADPGYRFEVDRIIRPDGLSIMPDRENPLLTLGRLTQADFCLMEEGPEGHVLTGAILCFPAYWTLAEKIGRALPGIHRPVHEYDDDVTRRVQRLFDAIRPERLLWRTNANIHASPDLFTPKREDDAEHRVAPEAGKYIRSERQILRRLPRTGVIVFSIHTYMVSIDSLEPEARNTLDRLTR